MEFKAAEDADESKLSEHADNAERLYADGMDRRKNQMCLGES